MNQILYITTSTTTVQVNPVTVDNPVQDLFYGFILFFMVFYLIVFFFKRRV